MSIGVDEKECVETLIPLLSENPIIFDVGSNKGAWSDIIMNKIPDAEVHLFEANIVMLHYTMAKYDYNDNKIFYINRAVCNQARERFIPFYYFTNRNNGLSSIYHNPGWDYLPMQKGMVQTMMLDEYIFRKNFDYIDFVKIDVEGAEMDVILGMTESLKLKKIRFIQVEYGAHYKISNWTFSALIALVYNFGYSVFIFENGNFRPVTIENFTEDYAANNYIISSEPLADTQDWNREFKNSIKDLPKFELALEVGCFEGRTTKYICQNMLTEEGRVVCLDPLADQYLVDNLDEAAVKMNSELPYFKNQYMRFLRNTRNLPVNLVRKKSIDGYVELGNLRFGFIYIDGDHREEAVYRDGQECFVICRVGGYILFDDYLWSEGTKKGIDRFLADHGHWITLIQKGYQVLVQKHTDV